MIRGRKQNKDDYDDDDEEEDEVEKGSTAYKRPICYANVCKTHNRLACKMCVCT